MIPANNHLEIDRLIHLKKTSWRYDHEQTYILSIQHRHSLRGIGF